MRKIFPFILILIVSFIFNSCYKETNILVNAQFQTTIQDDNYTAPVSVTVQNQTTGADHYLWTFEGGEPAASKEEHPGKVVYAEAGEYTIKLEAWNNNERDVYEFTFSVNPSVDITFGTEVLTNDFAPAEVKITNGTTGASSYAWVFEGGDPATSTDQHPANVTFDAPGDHKITLTVSNGRESFTTSRTITLLPKINVDFDIIPSFDDFDYEVPFTAGLINKTSSGLTYEWTATGGTIANENAENTEITINTAGTYTITLKAGNGKETKTSDKQIVLKSNTNLYTLKDVKFGIKNAENTVGSFYSLARRSILKKEEITPANGKDINLVFFGLNETFSRCYFLSPDDALNSGFTVIPDATKTYFVNDVSQTDLPFTDNDFNNMLDDTNLKALDIKTASSTAWTFTNVFVPRIVLFETAGGIKGAIRIKAFVSEGDDSYVLADIKVQKEKSN